MALGFSQGLLGGLRTFGQGGDMPADPNQRNVMQQYGVTNPLLQQFGQSVGMLVGRDMRSNAQIGTSMLAPLTDPTKTSKELFALAGEATQLGQPEVAGKLIEAAQGKQALEQKAQRRQTLSDAFKEKGYKTLSDMALDPTADMDELQKELTKLELVDIKGAKSRGARREMMKSAGFPAEALNDLAQGKFDGYTQEEFADFIQSRDAKLEIYLDPKTGEPKPYRVNSYGLVEDPNNPNSFVSAQQLGLTQAPQQIKNLSTGDSIAKKLTDGYTDSFLGLYDEALTANDVLRTNAIAQQELDKGIKSGMFASTELLLARFAKSLGMTGEFTDDIASTELFMTQRASQVLKLIKALGTGNAVSNTDREYVEKIVGGNINLDETTLRRLLELEREYGNQVIAKANQANDTLRNIVSKGGTVKDSDDLQILDAMVVDPYKAAKTREQLTEELQQQGYSPTAIQLALEAEGL